MKAKNIYAVWVGSILLHFLAAAGFSATAQEEPDEPPKILGLTEPRDGYPDISPDGQHIVFQSNRSGTWQLWTINTDGTGLARLTHSGKNDVTPVWSPDGTKIMFASDRDGGGTRDFDPAETFDARDIYVMDVSKGLANAEATTKRIIQNEADDMHPEWANGGKKIVFNRVYATEDGADILMANADGGGEARVETERGWNTYAALTPDGSRLIWRGTVEETRNGETVLNSEIFSALPNGKNRKRLTNSPAFDGWPAISPDGTTIAFASSRSGEAFHIYLMPIEGGEARQITFGTRFHYTQPAWSADGKTLAAFRWQEDEGGEIGHVVTLPLK